MHKESMYAFSTHLIIQRNSKWTLVLFIYLFIVIEAHTIALRYQGLVQAGYVIIVAC